MAAPPDKILLIEAPEQPDKELHRALDDAHFRVVRIVAGDDPQATVDAERPDLLLVDARSQEIRLDEPPNPDEPLRPAMLMLVDRFPDNGCRSDSIDYLASRNVSEIMARIKWHLRLNTLDREKHRLEQRLEASQRRASVGAISDGVAHNLNNVFGVIFGYMHLLKLHHEKPDMVLKHQEKLETAVNKATEIVRRFGLAARETEAPSEPVRVACILDQSIERFRREMTITRSYDFSVEPPDLVVNTRPGSIEDALVEVLKNAWQSYDDEDESQRTIKVNACAEADHGLVIRIRDHGCGIDPKDQPTLFEPFTGRRGKDGVGLTLARRSFRNLSGDLILSSHPEGGTVAEFRHPL